MAHDPYRSFLNAIALSQIQRKPQIPDAELNVGFMEMMQSLDNPQKGFSNSESTPRKISYYSNKTPIEDTAKKGEGNPAANIDFSSGSFYFGDPIGEVY